MADQWIYFKEVGFSDSHHIMFTPLCSPSGPCLSVIYAIVEVRKEIASIHQIERKERKIEEEEEDKTKGFLGLMDMVSIAECQLNMA